MASQVQICNLALSRVGAQRIMSLTDNTVESKLCNVIYNDIAEEVMSEGPWTSAIARAALNLTTNIPLYGFTNEFELPTVPRVLRILSVDADQVYLGSTWADGFRVEGDKLLANTATINVKYIGFIEDTASYDVNLKRCIVSRLAAEIAFPITGSAQLAERLYARYIKDLEDGLSSDGQQGSNDFTVSPDLLDIR